MQYNHKNSSFLSHFISVHRCLQSTRIGATLLATCFVLSLSGCGGGGSGNNGGSSSNVVSGIVADGYINGATVCLDMNKNTVCDPTEPSTQTVAGGAFSLTLANPNDINLYPLVVDVPPTAIDEDTGKPVGKGYVLSSPAASKAPFISPISTLIQSKINQGVTPAQAVIDIKTGLGFPANSTVDITSNFMTSKTLLPADKQKLRTSAQVIARVFAANNDVVKATLKKAGIKNKASQVNALVYKKASSQLGSIQQYASSLSAQAGPVQAVNIPSTVSLNLNGATFAADVGLTATQNTQLNQTLAGQGVTIPATTPLVINPDNSCVNPPSSLGGLSYAVALTAGLHARYCFNVAEAKQDVIIKTTKGLNRVKFTLEKQDPTTLAFVSVKGWTQHTYTRFSGVTPTSPSNAAPLTKGVYRITFSEDRLFIDAAKTTATVNVYSNSISRLEKQVNLINQNKFIVKPYALTLGSQTIKGSLNLVQDGIAKGLVKPTQVIEDVIPLQLSSPSLANVLLSVQTGPGVQVSLMNAAYALSILDQTMIAPADWQIWQGTTAQLKNKTFHFVKSKNTSDSYYLVLRRTSANSIFTYKASDDVPYTVTVTTSTVPAVTFTTGATPKNYQVGSYDKPVTAATGMFGAATIATAAGTLPTVSPSEFLTNTQNAKNLTSAMQTFKSVMEFDESATMRFYADYVDNINGVNNANAAVSLLDAAAGAAAGFLTGNYLGVADSLAITAAKASVGMSIAQSSKYHATIFMSYSFNLLRTYEQKKKAFINEVYALKVPISADLIGNSPILQSKLMELFVLQSRATRIMKFGMDLYKLTAQPNSQSYLAFMADRAANFAISFVPNSGALGIAANTLNTINGNLQLLVTDIINFAKLAKTLSTTWADLLNDSKYFSYYDPLVQANNLKILKVQGYVFDSTPPVITLAGAANITIPKGQNYVDLGATALDNVDGTITANIITNKTVNTLALGTYLVTYDVKDAAGNAATQVVRTVTVVSNAPKPTLSSKQATVAEGNAGISNLVFTVTLSAASANAVTVDYATSDGFGGTNSALAGSDYTAISGTLTIPAGKTSATITVPVSGDTVFETDEDLSLNLSNISFATFGAGSTGLIVPGLIINDDTGPILNFTGQPSVIEGSGGGTTTMTFNLSLNAPAAKDVMVNYSTSDLSATAPSDYAAASGVLTIPAGTLTGTINVLLVADNVVEPNENLLITLSKPVGALLGALNTLSRTYNNFGDIIDDDTAAVITPQVTNLNPPTATLGQPTTFTVTGTNLPSTIAMSLFDAAAPCVAVGVPTTTSAQVKCTPGTVGGAGNKPFYIKDKSGGVILKGATGLTVNVTAAAPLSGAALIASKLFNIPPANIDAVGNPPTGANYAYNPWGSPNAALAGFCKGYDGGHSGIDMQTKDVAGTLTANRTFYAVSSGTVIWAGGPSATGSNFNTIAIYDAVKNITVLYLHARSVSVVMGATVAVGDVLGIQGSTGVGAEHVHLEVRSGNRTGPACGKPTTIDPISNIVPYLKFPGAATNRLNDTGITTWGNGTLNNLTVTQRFFLEQDADHGRDALAAAATLVKIGGGNAGFDFTKLDAAGQPLANQAAVYANTPWSCVQDNVTGMMWEVKTTGGLGGLRDANHTYTWFNSTGINDGGNAGTANGGVCVDGINCDTEKYVAAVNAVGLCGFNDWRLPKKEALRSILDYSVASFGNAIDLAYFPNTGVLWYWSASPYAGIAIGAWNALFYIGDTNVGPKSYNGSVRLVRGGL